jgi:hypothetical protein
MNTSFRAGVAAAGVGLLLSGMVGMVGMASPAFAAKSKTPSSKSLKALSKSLKSAKGAKYVATYKVVSPGTAASTTVSIAQDPPKSAFSTGQGDGSIINTGTKTYYCSGAAGGPQNCIASGTTNPFAGLQDLFSPSSAIAAFSEAKEGLASKELGIKATESSQSIAGQSTTCVSVTTKGGVVGKYCVTKQGILAYAGTSKSYFELTKYSTSPPASLFTLPAGATTVTLPGGGSLP